MREVIFSLGIQANPKFFADFHTMHRFYSLALSNLSTIYNKLSPTLNEVPVQIKPLPITNRSNCASL